MEQRQERPQPVISPAGDSDRLGGRPWPPPPCRTRTALSPAPGHCVLSRRTCRQGAAGREALRTLRVCQRDTSPTALQTPPESPPCGGSPPPRAHPHAPPPRGWLPACAPGDNKSELGQVASACPNVQARERPPTRAVAWPLGKRKGAVSTRPPWGTSGSREGTKYSVPRGSKQHTAGGSTEGLKKHQNPQRG